jgi:mannosyltransferase
MAYGEVMQEISITPPTRSNTELWLCGLAIGFGCLVMLLWWYTRTSFWEDEIIAITHGNQALPLFFIETLRNDIHPPLYFLQLKLWHDIGLTSDAAVLFNSVVCALVSLATLFTIAAKAYNKKTAYYATALFALFPIFAYSGGNLRMYGLVPACVLLVWYANRNWFVTRERKWLVAAVVLEGVTSYLHAIEFFFVGFIALAACLECLGRRPEGASHQAGVRTGLRAWIVAQVVVLLLVAPLMISGLIRGSEASAPSSLFEMLTEPGALIAGWAAASNLWLRLAGLVIFLFLAAAAMLESRSRVRTLVIVIATLAVAIAVSILAKPMIKVPVFASSLLPFLALGAGAGIAINGNRSWRAGTFACMAALALAAVPLMHYQMTPDNYGQTGRLVRQLVRPGDVVVVPNVSVYWGVMRYAVGENWGQPLGILPLQANAQWNKIFAKLGPTATERLGLRPTSDHVIVKQVSYAIGEDARQTTANAQRVWVVQRNGYKVDAQLGGRFVRTSVTRPPYSGTPGPDDLAISLYTRDENGTTVARHPLNGDAP